MKTCPYCEEGLEVVDIDAEGFDILGCDDCMYDEQGSGIDSDMKFFI